MSQINSTNFFRWFTGSVIDETINFPRLGITDAKVYLPQLVSGEQVGFYINADVPFYDADDFTFLNLQIINSNGTVVRTDGGVITKVPLSLGYRIYVSYTLPNLNLGQYQFAIYNSETSTTKCVSNYFQVISAADADLHTVKVKWRNSRDAYYYDWSQVPDFYCELRLNISLASYQPEETIDQTKAVSTGTRRNNNYDTDLSYKLSTYYFDDGANLACIPLFKADNLVINGKNYIQKSAYLPNARAISGVSIGEVELYDQYFSRINKFGQLPQLVAKTGKVVIINTTAEAFTLHKYSSDNTAIGTVAIPATSAVAIDINDLQINSYLNVTADVSGTYNTILANSLPDGTFQYSTDTVTTPDPFSQITQNQVYNNEWFLTIAS